MDKKKIKRYILVSIVILILTIVMELTEEGPVNNTLKRPKLGEGELDTELIISGEGIEDYQYNLTVKEEKISEEEARKAFAQAKEEIDGSVFNDERPDRVTKNLNLKKSYAQSRVEADWNFNNPELIDMEGQINSRKVAEEGAIVQAQVTLSYGEHEEEYCFSFNLYPRILKGQEKIIDEIDQLIEEQQERVGDDLKLPSEIGGKKISWKQVNQHLIIKVLFFEVVIGILLVVADKEKKKTAQKKRADEMKLDYSDIVSKMAILLGSGMTIRQTWNTISAHYLKEREESNRKPRFAYEEILITYYEMRDGISEKNAYQRFGERSGVSEYHRLSRVLVQNLQKGNRGLCQLLEKESALAFEERKLIAKKMGEEAGTRLLVPLIIIMVLVMAIVMFPAMLGFSV